jgi:hypothetical protein
MILLLLMRMRLLKLRLRRLELRARRASLKVRLFDGFISVNLFVTVLLLQAQSESNQGARRFKNSRCMRAINVARYRRGLPVCF